MAEIEQPFFMTNDEWWTFNYEQGKIELTSKAPPKAIDSYNDYYKLWEETMESQTVTDL